MKEIDGLKKEIIFFRNSLNDIVEKHPDGIIIIDSNGVILSVNQVIETMFGRKREDLINRVFGFPLIQDEFFEIDIIRKNGLHGTGEIRIGNFVCGVAKTILVSIRDITDRKKMVKELKIAKEKAEESNRLKSIFLSSMTYNLRTPLNAVIGFSELIEKNPSSDIIREYAKTIKNSGTHLLDVIDDILDISMLQAGEIKVRNEKFHLNETMREIHKIIKIKQQVDKKEHLDIRFKPDEKFQEIIINSDQQKIKQIMISLLRNALKFTNEGYIEYGYIIGQAKDTSQLKFYVEDTGIGIPKDKHKIIFNRFIKVDNDNTRKSGGTGLGLTIIQYIIEILGGKIGLISTPGKGSTFNFIINCQINGISTVKKSKDKKIATTVNWNNKTILITENYDIDYQLTRLKLKETNAKIIRAINGQEAIDICENNTDIDLVLMDIQMPVKSGYYAATKIKQIRKNLPIIAQTAYAMDGDREKALDTGCEDYISKPVDLELLISTIGKYI